jgi:glucokinase
VIKSHQIAGWEDVPLANWCEKTLGLQTRIGNDCNLAALAEARFGAGRNRRVVFYLTVGSGVGGGLVVDGQPFGLDRPAVAEIGHLRPGLGCHLPDATVESLASGWGMAKHAQQCLRDAAGVSTDRPVADEPACVIVPRFVADKPSADGLLAWCGGDPQRLTAELIGEAAAEGNSLARHVLAQATRALGWAIAQAITLVAPEVVVIGGGVSNLVAALFLDPVRSEVRRYVFPPLADSYEIVPAALGELVVVHGALALAAQTSGKEGGASAR